MQSKLRDCNRSNKLLTDCLTFRRTMTQLRKQTLTLVKVMTTLLYLQTKVKRRFHNHGEGPYYGLLLVDSAYTSQG